MKRMGVSGLTLAILAQPGLTQEFTSVENSILTPMAQVTAVSQLTDVKPTDWAFQTIQSLGERYDCLAGYPDRTFRGSRALSRAEFAAGLHVCLGRIKEFVPDAIPKEDLIKLQAIQTDFALELTSLKSRVEELEGKTKTLTSQVFTPTTRLYGEVVLGIQGSNHTDVDVFPRNGIPESQGRSNSTLSYNAQLTLTASFQGDDLLTIGLLSGNLRSTEPNLFTNMGIFSYEAGEDNKLAISDLYYEFALSDRLGIVVGPVGLYPENTFRSINPLEGIADGALSRFAQHNPIISLGGTDAGVGFAWSLGDRTRLQGVYSSGMELFKDRYSAALQLTLSPTNTLDVALNYIYAHTPDGEIGLGVGDTQIFSPFATDTGNVNTHGFGAIATWRISPSWTIGAWGGWTKSKGHDLNGSDLSGFVRTTNWAFFSTFPDLFRQGNLGGVVLGQPPKIVESTLPEGFNFPRYSDNGESGGQPDTALHLELFYRAKLSANFSVTPGLIVVFNPNHNQANETLTIGALRASFQF